MIKKMHKAQEQALLMLIGLTFLALQAKGGGAGEELPIATSGLSLGTSTTMKLQSLPPSTDKGPIQSAEKPSNPATLVSRKRDRDDSENEQDGLETEAKKRCDTNQSSSSSSSSSSSAGPTSDSNQDLSRLPPLPAQQQRTTEIESVRNVLMDATLDPDARVDRACNMFVAMDLAGAATIAIGLLNDASIDINTRAQLARNILATDNLKEHHKSVATTAIGFLNDASIDIDTRVTIAHNILVTDNLKEHHKSVTTIAVGWLSDESIDINTFEDIASDILASEYIDINSRVELAIRFFDEFDYDEGTGFSSEKNTQDLVTTVEPWVTNDNIPIQKRAKLASGILEANGWGENESEYSTSVAETVRGWIDNNAIDTETLAKLIIKIMINSNGVYRETQLEVAEAAIKLLSDTKMDFVTRTELASMILDAGYGLTGQSLEPAVDLMMDMLRYKDDENYCETIEESLMDPEVLGTLSEPTLIKMLNHTDIEATFKLQVQHSVNFH